MFRNEELNSIPIILLALLKNAFNKQYVILYFKHYINSNV